MMGRRGKGGSEGGSEMKGGGGRKKEGRGKEWDGREEVFKPVSRYVEYLGSNPITVCNYCSSKYSYCLIREAKKPSFVRLDMRNNEELKTHTKFLCEVSAWLNY